MINIADNSTSHFNIHSYWKVCCNEATKDIIIEQFSISHRLWSLLKMIFLMCTKRKLSLNVAYGRLRVRGWNNIGKLFIAWIRRELMQSYRRATMPLNNKPVLYRYKYRGNLSFNWETDKQSFRSFEEHHKRVWFLRYVVSEWTLCIYKSSDVKYIYPTAIIDVMIKNYWRRLFIKEDSSIKKLMFEKLDEQYCKLFLSIFSIRK